MHSEESLFEAWLCDIHIYPLESAKWSFFWAISYHRDEKNSK